jgi:hypothetical protein
MARYSTVDLLPMASEAAVRRKLDVLCPESAPSAYQDWIFSHGSILC